MKTMGIDFGDCNIGIAVSDPFGWTAQGVETIKYKPSHLDTAIGRIHQLATTHDVGKIVVGLPKNLNGTLSEKSVKVMEFMEALKIKIHAIEIITWDERLTTVSANRTMHETGVKKMKKKGIVDTLAAMYILQNYLDFMAHNS